MGDALWQRSALELAELIRSKEVSSREVVRAHLDRIDEVNDAVNAITVTLADAALTAADEADGAKVGGPFHGVPFTIKENLDCVGSATTQGVPALVDAIPPLDAPIVARMKRAGAIPLARTNLPEFGLRISTDNPLRGRTNNPWNLDRTSGGSSGGEGAALATGMSPIGLGNDIGGSVRNPAYCCGVTALKPTPGRLPMASSIPPLDPMLASQLMSTDGPMARRVGDLRVAMQVMGGRDTRDPRSVDVPFGQSGEDRGKRQVRVAGLVTSIPGVTLAPSFVEAIRAAGAALEHQGWKTVESSPPDLDLVNEVWASVLSFGVATMRPALEAVMSAPAVALLDGLLGLYTMPIDAAFLERHRLIREWSAFFADHPVVIGPIWTDVPFEHDADLDPERGMTVTLDRLRFITPGNVLGIPSCAVPTGVSYGLPTGVQVYADLWRDDLCLDCGQIIEDELGVITPIDPVTS
jgi:amidase